MDINETIKDLVAEPQALDNVVAQLDDQMWTTPTSSDRWNVADQIGHLTYFDNAASLAITDPDKFRSSVDDLIASAVNGSEASDDFTLGQYRSLTPESLLATWREGRENLSSAASTLDNESRVIWYGPSMGSNSFLTSRLMEVWAHGQDIIDAVGGDRPDTERLRHIAHLGAITRQWSYLNRRLEIPEGEVYVSLAGPGDQIWTWGPSDAMDSVEGFAKDFCLVVTQRRHLGDTELKVEGDLAKEWMELAQAFAGPPTDGPAKRSN